MSRKLSKEESLQKLTNANPNFDYSEFEYINCETKSKIICDKGHQYETSFSSIIAGNRCPHCANHKSKPEYEIIEYIKIFYSGNIEQSNRNIIPSFIKEGNYLEIDILLPDLNFAIEFNGRYWHSDEQIQKRTKGIFKTAEEFHNYKTNKCLEKGITLLHISEEDYLKDKEKILNEIKELILSK